MPVDYSLREKQYESGEATQPHTEEGLVESSARELSIELTQRCHPMMRFISYVDTGTTCDSVLSDSFYFESLPNSLAHRLRRPSAKDALPERSEGRGV